MDYAQMKAEKDARYEQYSKIYETQLRFMRYIESLERDNNNMREAEVTTNRAIRRRKKLIKINDRDIKMYKKALSKMPSVPEFK